MAKGTAARADAEGQPSDPVEEVRCRRLVVVGPDGTERVVLDAGADFGLVDVISPAGPRVSLLADEQSRSTPCAALHFVDDPDAAAPVDPFLGVKHGASYVEGFSAVDELVERVKELERAIERLTIGLAQEVRTERLVVVDETGRERVATLITPTASTLEVMAPGTKIHHEPARVSICCVYGENWRERPLGARPEPCAQAVVRTSVLTGDRLVDEDSAALCADGDGPATVEILDHRWMGAAATLGVDGVTTQRQSWSPR